MSSLLMTEDLSQMPSKMGYLFTPQQNENNPSLANLMKPFQTWAAFPVFLGQRLCMQTRAWRCWSQGRGGTIFSTCTSHKWKAPHTHKHIHNHIHTQKQLRGKWSYCAARVGDAKQGMKTPDFFPFKNQILAFLCLQPWS